MPRNVELSLGLERETGRDTDFLPLSSADKAVTPVKSLSII